MCVCGNPHVSVAYWSRSLSCQTRVRAGVLLTALHEWAFCKRREPNEAYRNATNLPSTGSKFLDASSSTYLDIPKNANGISIIQNRWLNQSKLTVGWPRKISFWAAKQQEVLGCDRYIHSQRMRFNGTRSRKPLEFRSTMSTDDVQPLDHFVIPGCKQPGPPCVETREPTPFPLVMACHPSRSTMSTDDVQPLDHFVIPGCKQRGLTGVG